MEDSILAHIEEYLEWQKAAGFTARTVLGGKRRLLSFVLFLAHEGISRTADVTASSVHGYTAHIRARFTKDGKPFAQATIDGLLSAARTFLKWAAKHRLVFFDLSDEFPKVKTRRVPARTLTALEAERILSMPDTDTPEGVRDRTLLEILYSTGLRRMEAANLKLEDVNLQACTIFVRQGKGKKDRLVPAGERVMMWIKRYLADARPVLTTWTTRAKQSRDDGWLFPHRFGGRLGENRVSQIAGSYVRKTGIERGACHLFRHTMATLMLENGADVRYIQEMLGHAGIETTQIYTKVSSRHLKETLTRSHPVSWEAEPGFSAEIGHARTIEPRRFAGLRLGKPKHIPEIDRAKSHLHAELADFREWCIATRARATAENHVRYTILFADWALLRGVTKPAQATPELLLEYQKELGTEKNKKGETHTVYTVRNRMISVRWFFRWLWKNGRTLTDPSAPLMIPRQPRHLPADVLSVDEVEKILAVPDITTPYGIRDRAVIELFYATGMRKMELSGIKLEDLNHENQTIRITDSKSKDFRVIPAGSRAFKWIELYLDCARSDIAPGTEDSGFLFLCGHGEGLGERMGEFICRKHIKAAGIQKKKACRIFRHTTATLMLENGADIRAVQEFLGHRSIRTTERYTHVAIKKLKEVHAATHPGEKRYLEKLRESEKVQETDKENLEPEIKPQVKPGVRPAARTIAGNEEMPA